MNHHLKLAHAAGVSQALQDFGITKEATFRNLKQYLWGKPLVESLQMMRTPRDAVRMLNNKKLQALLARPEGLPPGGLGARIDAVAHAGQPHSVINPRHVAEVPFRTLPPNMREALEAEIKRQA